MECTVAALFCIFDFWIDMPVIITDDDGGCESDRHTAPHTLQLAAAATAAAAAAVQGSVLLPLLLAVPDAGHG